MTTSAPAPLPPDAPWIVLKFGGTSVATSERWRTILELAAARRAEGARVLVVVSALSGVTDALKALCACAPDERGIALQALHEKHRVLVAQMRLMRVEAMERWLASLSALASDVQEPGEGSSGSRQFGNTEPSPQPLSRE
ncbi:MAG TPA: hypothetical protein VFH52_03390, partial [Rhodanobacteraceae bacterium]|nr:hypothetical protein [Rhodanobacteraceae bacterium]